MIEPWFSAEIARSFSLLSLLALLACLQPLARAGRAKALVMSSFLAATGLALTLLISGIVGFVASQPSYVYGTLLFAGGLTFGLLLYYDWKIIRTYQAAELQRSVASDL